jgi:hypothetical protein
VIESLFDPPMITFYWWRVNYVREFVVDRSLQPTRGKCGEKYFIFALEGAKYFEYKYTLRCVIWCQEPKQIISNVSAHRIQFWRVANIKEVKSTMPFCGACCSLKTSSLLFTLSRE